MTAESILIPPFYMEIDGVTVEVLEVLKHQLISGDKYYTVALRIHYKDIVSKIFNLTVKDEEELKNKLKIEITKIKFMEYAYGLKYVKGVIT